MLQKLLTVFTKFKARPAVTTGENLYGQCVSQSRQVPFYTDYGVEDEIGARFELLCLHVILVLHVMKLDPAQSDHEQAKETSQALFDALLRALDDTMREQGVGDLSVAKKMKALGRVVYARLKAWDDLLSPQANAPERADYILKTVYARDEDDGAIESHDHNAALMAEYVEKALKTLSVSALLRGKTAWPELN
ncbi:ubiquinol-cytochrome C chaperone family protein [Asticcacaulis machinosus]|uniref:Ubiquinol-cytochrome C chaperone family protein n=1 Tax=Asticcacaulis machinosus TaxID=2984211 RepID=A0ABT5HES7_9CAUL|nr:ubiquinol-cytochrome C chaperone family protein [Asticcacaulis machinosus]MDC7674762.1 ubiquinol-cytochrome C chaperone family protein [Asticcacaulis machinosus]